MGDKIDSAIAAAEDGPEVVYVNDDGTVSEEPKQTGFQFKDLGKKGRGKVSDTPAKKVWPQELLDRAAALVDADVIRDGGDYREDAGGRVFWLDLDHLVEFEEADQRIDSDKEFWQWFKDYRQANGIEDKRKNTWSTWGSHKKWDWEYERRDSKTNYMTSWWGGWGYNSKTETNRKLAIALGAVQSIVEVINDTGKRFKTELAADDDRVAPQSYTSFDEQRVVVSPQALLDTSISEEDGIEVTAGWGLHEGSHVRFTTSLKDAMVKPTILRPLALASQFMNLLEDVRIEAKTSEQFPGFAGYFNKSNSYLWDVTKDHAPKEWGPELRDKANAITAITKWETQYAEVVANSTDQRLKDEFAWFSAWRDRYPKEPTPDDARKATIEALRHLEDDPETKQQMQQQQQKEETIEKQNGASPQKLNDDQFRDLMDQLKDALKGNGNLMEPCPSPTQPGGGGRQVELTADQAREVNQLIREHYEEQGATPLPGAQSDGDKVIVTKPEETQTSKAFYKKPGALVAKMKAAFVFRKIAPEYSERALRTGNLDEDMLWKITGNDLKVFERRVVTDIPETQVTMLVDLSSSMGWGGRIDIAQELATTMLECLAGMKGVRVRVRGHRAAAGNEVFRLWEKGDPRTRLGLIKELCAGGTPDGLALDNICKEMYGERRHGEDMLVFMLADGGPNVAPQGMDGYQHVRAVVDHWKKKGITVVSISLDKGLDRAAQAQMYDHWIPFESEQRLPQQLTKMLIKLFGGASS